MDDIDHNKLDAALERLEAERERRLAEKIEAGEIIEVPLWVVAGSQAGACAQVEQAKADKLAELRAAGETREVVFEVTTVATGVCKHGEATETNRGSPQRRHSCRGPSGTRLSMSSRTRFGKPRRP